MEDGEQTREEEEEKLEAQMMAAVKKCIPAVRVAQNATKILRRLSSATTDMVVAALEARSSDLRLRTQRNEFLIGQLAQLPRGQAHIGVKIAERLVDEQHRLDEVVLAGIRHVVGSEEPLGSKGGVDEVDDDWIESFGREAVQRSRSEMRETFARILAGEIRQPGTFSIRALRTVSGLSKSTATLFRRAASLRVGLEVMAVSEGGSRRQMMLDARVPAVDGELKENSLQKEGLGYGQLTELTENGLLHSDYDSLYGYELATPQLQTGNTVPIPLIHQNQNWALLPLSTSKKPRDSRIRGARFTTVGQELLTIVDIEEDSAFLQRLQSYFRSRHWKMVPVKNPKKLRTTRPE